MSITELHLATRSERAQRDHLRACAADAAERYADADADTVLSWAAHTFGAGLAVASSMAESVLPHLASRHRPGVDVLFLDTGYHFAETLATRDRVAAELDVTVVDLRPDLTVAEQDAQLGPRLHDRDPGACCAMRKVEPLRRALAGYSAWVTGVRRAEGPTRADTPVVAFDESFGLVKINPLAAWSDEEVRLYADLHDLPANPLLSRGYPSIGCSPCTRAVAPGDDPRAGRWSGFAKTECGLHGGPEADASESREAAS
ncbi:phosphoadenylyl-sulfate reductase [Serinicoccus kebangsaanensis]|uniref:phosphoadenylyl-sulfate reductase n=1 Tax=Serinicoccus kebangsaanensis TaxID=2602069 RepID=UPI00124EAC40|nr:phosphoadenylyl-sulfate reductase [Serinicoccus kebangsaanensis]